MNRLISTLLILLVVNSLAFATHERAGNITYKNISGLTYEITLTTYTYTPSPADRPELEIHWGDGTSSVLPRSEIIDFPDDIRRNIYIGQHTYAGQGEFHISLEDPNRNRDIVNIPQSDNIPFYIETVLVINQFLGINNSVVLSNPPLDNGCVNRLYIHNPGAYDQDGDSLSFKLTICKGLNGLPIPGYKYPQASNQFSMDPVTGDLIWDKPIVQGEYNVAFIVEEWRFGQRIGYVTRDLQIHIGDCDNEPPEIITIDDTCINAGDILEFEVTAIDPDGDKITLSANGSPFVQNDSPAIMLPNPVTGNVTVSADIHWNTNCSHIKKNPHPVYFKAIDHSTPVALTSYKNVNITIAGPPPENPEAVPIGTSVKLSWSPNNCNNVAGYWIYRRLSFYGFVPSHCELGVPSYTGYSKIKELSGIDNTIYFDDNNGAGLVHGMEYCYLIVAVFPDGAESYASEEVCARLEKDIPVITNVSVINTDEANGSMYLAWSKPTDLDTIQIPGPYEYRLLRKDNSVGSEFEETAVFDQLNDTIYTDILLNTLNLQYRYKVDFYNMEPGNTFQIGSTVVAPSIYITIKETNQTLLLSWNNDVPWINDTFVVYRQDPGSLDFDSIGWSDIPEYTDTGLINGQEYCYFVKSIGGYSGVGTIDPIINYSQIKCGIPVDNIPPCPPFLSIETNCEDLTNELTWVYPDTCEFEDSIYYKIYYSPNKESDYSLIHTTQSEIFSYTFFTNPPSVVGCFSISAIDTLHNESYFSNIECVDINECGRIWFPNVFTPNSDGINDFFRADSANSIKRLELKIFNRWGTVVYETENPFFRWDGKDHKNKGDCSDGVYFYYALVSEYSLRGPLERKVTGSVTLLR